MIEISFSTVMFISMFAWILFRSAAFLKNKCIDWKFEVKQIIFLINLLVIIRFTFHPFSTVDGQVQPLIFDSATAFPFRVNLIPFVNLMNYESKSDLLINIIGNFAMFIPSGIVLPIIYKNITGLKKVVLTGFGISLVIELIQLPFAVRASDVDDLILNIGGCIAGYGIYALVRWLKCCLPHKSSRL